MIGFLGSRDVFRQKVTSPTPARRRQAAVVLGTLAVPLALAGFAAPSAAAAQDPTVTATISVGSSPTGVGVDPSTNTIYVANGASDFVSVINGATNTVTANIPMDNAPEWVAVNPATDTIYVPDGPDGTVLVIDGATDLVTATINVGQGGAGPLAVDPSTNTVYVAGFDRVTVINGATDTVTAYIGLVVNPGWVAVNPSTNTIYAPSYGYGMFVISGATNTVTADVNLGGGNTVYAVAVDPSTNTIYATSGQVAVINGATNTVIAHIDVGLEPVGVDVDPSTDTIYAANIGDNTVSVIDGTTNTVTATVGVGNGPYGVGVDPSTHAVYVTNTNDNTVSVITSVTDADLTIAQPANITTDATGPNGATVSYPAPVVTDPDDASPPAPACSPASGMVFVVGTTTVTCTAIDSDDSNSPVSTSFSVTVEGAASQLSDLSQAVQGVGPGNSLASKVQQAQSDLASGDVTDACGTLGAFINQVQAQSGKKIPASQAAQLIADAQRIQAVLAC